ncbi:MAG: flgC [Bacilli bacterium]|nr:flgC [Bacilli bacterium]
MGLFDGMMISASGLTAQRLRLDVISNNIANADTTRTPEGGPYARQMVTFSPIGPSFAGNLQTAMGSDQSAGMGVQVSAVESDTQTPFKLVYDPSHPDAVKDPNSPMYGYVRMPNVDVSSEMVDMISASRSYEANVTALNAYKAMLTKALEIGRG